MANTLMTLFLVAFLFVISQDVVICETTCSSVLECAHITCHTGYPRCLRGVCRCHPEVAMASDKISCRTSGDCPIDYTKCKVGIQICTGGTCTCGEHEDGLASSKITSCKSNEDCPIDLTKCKIGVQICVGGTCRCGEHKDALANDHFSCQISSDCEGHQKCVVGYSLCADGICICSD
ncbi:defensin-like protein [Capsicum chacoense]